MAASRFAKKTRTRFTAAIAAVLAFVAIVFLSINVAREINRLERRGSDSAQWSLSQTEIEFLELFNQLRAQPADLTEIRLRYDVFYSRITTVSLARAFSGLRETKPFQEQLTIVETYLAETVAFIDAPDAELESYIPTLDRQSAEIRNAVRQLAFIGLDLFTQHADQQRQNVATTTAQLATAIVALVGGLGLALFHLDRTNKRAAERGRALLQSATRMNTIIETALDGVIVTDSDYAILEFSPAAEEIFGVTANDVTGKDVFSFIDFEPTAVEGETDANSNGNLGRRQRTAHRADGTAFPAEIAFQSAETPSGQIHIAFVRDISRRVEVEKEIVAARDAALESEQMKSDFLATMSHEIRTPLNGLLGNMDLLRDTALTPPQARYVQNMETSGRMLMRHVTDVLDITQFDSGKMTIASRVMHLPTLIDDIIATQTSLATAHDTTLSWKWGGQPVSWVTADPDRIQHILMNLIGNAVKFTKNGSVTMTVDRYDRDRQVFLRFQITDTGPGIAPDLLPHIFDDFVTGDAGFDREVGGTGLGLSIAKRFAVGLGGTVEVNSTLGSGSTFRVDLPITLTEGPKKRQSSRTLPPIRVQKILIVEDNAINRVVAREMLEADGHHVIDVKNGAEGVATANATKFDLILMDISMPVMDGYEAAGLIMQGGGASAATPIVAHTANVLSGDRARYLASGMVSIITKPLIRAELRAMLRALDAPAPIPNEPVLDLLHLEDVRSALTGIAYADLQTRLRTEVDDFVAWFLSAPPKPMEEVAEKAHHLAGSAALFGMKQLGSALNALEQSARGDASVPTLSYRHILPQIWADADQALHDVIDEDA